MKYITALLATIVCCQNISAQKKDFFKSKPWNDFKNRTLPGSLTQQYYTTPAIVPLTKKFISPVLKIPLAATFSVQNFKGDDIWKMQAYNMPCLIPSKTMNYNMPVAATAKTGIDFESPFTNQDSPVNP